MGWLRDLMLDAEIPSFGELARACLSHPSWPEQNRKPSIAIAWLYGPIADGASGVETSTRGIVLPLVPLDSVVVALVYIVVPVRDSVSAPAPRGAAVLGCGRSPPRQDRRGRNEWRAVADFVQNAARDGALDDSSRTASRGERRVEDPAGRAGSGLAHGEGEQARQRAPEGQQRRSDGHRGAHEVV